jgi:hypothetical protein
MTPSLPLSHEAARLSVDRQGNNNRGVECHDALKAKSFVAAFSPGFAKHSFSEN